MTIIKEDAKLLNSRDSSILHYQIWEAIVGSNSVRQDPITVDVLKIPLSIRNVVRYCDSHDFMSARDHNRSRMEK